MFLQVKVYQETWFLNVFLIPIGFQYIFCLGILNETDSGSAEPEEPKYTHYPRRGPSAENLVECKVCGYQAGTMDDLACIPCNADTPEAKVKLLVAQQEEKLYLLLKIRLEEEKLIEVKSKSLPPTVAPSASSSSRSLDSAPGSLSGPGFVVKTLPRVGIDTRINKSKNTHQQ